ncbi:hypothetical protein MASSI9I_10316 [Massilia sp. 9I]|nr:hypothetical protein MASSI9I_10316 [Massilia sp. 9I]
MHSLAVVTRSFNTANSTIAVTSTPVDRGGREDSGTAQAHPTEPSAANQRIRHATHP